MRRALRVLAFLLLPGLAVAADPVGEGGAGIPFKKDSGAPGGFTVAMVILGAVAMGAVYVGNRRRQSGRPNEIEVVATRRVGMRTGLILVRVKGKEILLAHANDRLDVIESWAAEQKKEAV